MSILTGFSMQPVLTLPFVLIALIPTAFAQSTFKCSVSGAVVYQDRPCTGGKGDEMFKPKPPPVRKMTPAEVEEDFYRSRGKINPNRPLSSLSPLEKLQLEDQKLDELVREGDAKLHDGRADIEFQEKLRSCGGRFFNSLAVGMTEQQMLRCSTYTRPDSVNTTVVGSVVMKQYVFGKSSPRTYAHFRNGILTGYQD